MSHSERVAIVDVLDLMAVGQPLPFHVLDAHARRLLAEGHVLVSRTQLDMLIARGAWVEKSRVQAVRAEQAGPRSSLVPSSRRTLSLFDQWEQLIWKLDATLRLVLAGKPVVQELTALAERVEGLAQRDLNVALFMMVRQHEVRFALYALQHALHAATVLLVLGEQLGWQPSQVRLLVLSALTMNVSTLELQAQLAQQEDPPNQRQRRAIAAHPDESVRLLRQAGVSDGAWLQTVAEHHEKPDGSGYPARIQKICESAHALRLADVFTAKISARANRAPMAIQLATRQLFEEEKGSPLAIGMIKALGLYPPGELVRLASGEVAVVTHRGTAPTKPKVASVTDTDGKPVIQTRHHDTSDPAFAVVGVFPSPKTLPRIPPERVYGIIPG